MSDNGDDGLPMQGLVEGAVELLSGTSRVDRLLRERLRKTQSHATIYSDASTEILTLLESEDNETQQRQRLIIIANRLPVTATKDPSGNYTLEPSSGGLASAMLGLGNFDISWIGWPGVFVPEGPARDQLTETLTKQGYHPVYLDQSAVDLYYNGFCNQVLWQLFHYVPLNLDSKLSETRTLQKQWEAYQEVNQNFANVAMKIHEENDIVWVQDYHLMLLPALLKDADPSMKVGWFLHTPFPSSEIYRTLPVREEVLRSALRADLVGFHTYDYGRHFVSACTRILGFEGTPNGVEGEDSGQITRVAAFPIGIDPQRFADALEMEEVKNNIQSLRRRYAGRKVMLGVDRLDMIKGIPQKLLAYEKFLEEHPEWRDKVLLVQIAVPSRIDVPEYQQLRAQVHEIVGRINGKFGTLTHCPIHHLDRGLNFRELCALYAVTDVALVTSLRDGMNLVSYEYVACQNSNAGVLVLSEFAGAAQSLGAGAILVNPWNVNEMAVAISDALTMSREERYERHSQNYAHVTNHTAQHWADTFISELNDTHVENKMRMRHVPPDLPLKTAIEDFLDAKGRRMLVLGYNATLTQLVEAPRQPKHHFDQIKAHSTVNPHIYDLVQKLAAHPLITVVIFSGSDRFKLKETFGSQKDVWLVAENGVYIRPPRAGNGEEEEEDDDDDDEWMKTISNGNQEWLASVRLVFEYFRERTPRSFVEVRESSLVWNYKYADVEFGRLQARDLLQHLWTGPISNAPVDIVQGSRSVEARPVSVSKGGSMQRVLEVMCEMEGAQSLDFEYVLCMGHFLQRDENLYTYFEGKNLGPLPKDNMQKVSSVGSEMSAVSLQTQEFLQNETLRAAVNDLLTSRKSMDHAERHTKLHGVRFLDEAVAQSLQQDNQQDGDAEHECESLATSISHNAINIAKSVKWGSWEVSSEDLPSMSTGCIDLRNADSASELSGIGTGPSKDFLKNKLRSHESVDLGMTLSELTRSDADPENGSTRVMFGGRPIPPGALSSQEHLLLYSEKESLASRWRAELGLSLPRRSPRKQRSKSSMHGSHSSSDLSGARLGSPSVANFPPRFLYTCSVGRNQSKARYCLSGTKDVSALLDELVNLLPELPVRLPRYAVPPPWISPGRSALRMLSTGRGGPGRSIGTTRGSNGEYCINDGELLMRRHTVSHLSEADFSTIFSS